MPPVCPLFGNTNCPLRPIVPLPFAVCRGDFVLVIERCWDMVEWQRRGVFALELPPALLPTSAALAHFRCPRQNLALTGDV